MDRAGHRERFLAFLQTILRPGIPLSAVEEHDGLLRSGLIDSLAVLSIVDYLETEYGIDFAERGLDPGQVASVSRVLDLIERETS
jgi:acyl carrier protein